MQAEASSVTDRVAALLECCATSGRTLTLTDLIERTGMPKSTVHRVAWKLVTHGLLEHTAAGFRIGTKLFAMGAMNPHLRQLRCVTAPVLHALASQSGLVVNLAILSDGHALVVDEICTSNSVPRHRAGALMPLHATAIGKALLLGMNPQELDTVLGDEPLTPFTRHTIVQSQHIRSRLDAARGMGVVFSNQEWSPGSSGVAAPVFVRGAVFASVGVIGRPDRTVLNQYANPVRRAAADIAQAFDAIRMPVAA